MGHHNRLSREAVNAPSLQVFKASLDGVLKSLSREVKVHFSMAGGLELDDF